MKLYFLLILHLDVRKTKRIEQRKSNTDVRECLLSFTAKSPGFQFGIQKQKDQDIQICNFACCFVLVRNFVSLTFRKKHRLRTFENRVIYSPHTIRVITSRMEFGAHMAAIGERRGAYRVIVARPGRNRPLRRRRRGLEDNIQIDLKISGIGRHGLD